jgi:hypothetical protein
VKPLVSGVLALIFIARVGYYAYQRYAHHETVTMYGFVDSNAPATGLSITEQAGKYVVTDVAGQGAYIHFPDRPTLRIKPNALFATADVLAEMAEDGRELHFHVIRLDVDKTYRLSADEVYDNVQRGVLESTHATLDRRQDITVDGLPGRELTAHADDVQMRLRVVLDRRNALVYFAGAFCDDEDDLPAAQHFVRTLHVRPS